MRLRVKKWLRRIFRTRRAPHAAKGFHYSYQYSFAVLRKPRDKGSVVHRACHSSTNNALLPPPMTLTRIHPVWSGVVGSEGSRRGCLSTLSVVTHLSADRLPQLGGLCAALATDVDVNTDGLITLCVAILLEEDDVGPARVLRAVRALPGVGHDFVVQLACFAYTRTLYRGDASPPRWYPINKLRNRALALAETDLVLICDVDFRPCRRLAFLTGVANEREALLRRASCRLNCIVLPAFEALINSSGDGGGGTHTSSRVDSDTTSTGIGSRITEDDSGEHLDKSWWLATLGSKHGLLQQWDGGRVVPFASRVWAQGHSPTNFTLWKEANAPYEVTYEEGFEPFVVMNRLLVPPFDERFEGYGRNKVCACL